MTWSACSLSKCRKPSFRSVDFYFIEYNHARREERSAGSEPLGLCGVGPGVGRRRRVPERQEQEGDGLVWVLPLAVVSLLPYEWYVFAANPSYDHAFFTYRCQLVTFVCLGLMLSGAVQLVAPATLRLGSREAQPRD